MGVDIRPTDVGKRVSVQYFNADGTRSEVVGIFERAELDGTTPILHIRKADDSVVTVPMNRIRFGKVVRDVRGRAR